MDLLVLGSGSSGNAAIVRCGGTTVLVDAGLSARKLLARLAALGVGAGDIDAVLLTHEHGDHTGALPVLMRSLRCPIYATRLTADELCGQDPRNASSTWRTFSTGASFAIGSLQIDAFSVPHDAADPVGFTIRCQGVVLGLLTDLGHVNRSVIHHVTGAHCLFVEANHDEALLQADTKRPFAIKQRIMSSHGHLSNRAAADLATQILESGLRHVVLGHLSRDCNAPDIAIATVREALHHAQDVSVVAAGQDEPFTLAGIGTF
ncbi:MAG: MBL fold metallo-hydrolase [Chthoniobacterales bacterium]|nr:MBL fold metallo-hydrolase [Chthoniobacterales bacterium]